MFDQLIQQFTGSRQGQTAMSRLSSQGFAPHQAQQFLGAAVPAAAQSFHQAQSGGLAGARPGGPGGLMDVGNSHYVTNFLSGAVSGLLRGEGMMGAAVDGLQGVAGGHVAQVIASRFGLPQRVAGTVGAIVTPLVIDFLFERVNGGSLNLGSLFGGGGPGLMAGAGGMAQQMMSGGWGGSSTTPAFGGAPPSPPAFGGGSPSGGWGNTPASGGVSPTIPGGIGGLLGGLFGGGR